MFLIICTTILLCSPRLFHCLSSEELCSNKVCSGCIAGSLSCQEGGLSRLPDNLNSDITSIIFIGHKFLNPILVKGNFSRYGIQAQQIQRLTLRNCGIERLQPGAFQTLTSLTQLDLSQNHIRIIETGTFIGLKLEFLRLDENTNLYIAPGGFEGLMVASLSMNQCGFKTITFDDLSPLFSGQLLTNLQLSSNRLETLDSRLEFTFLSLESLALDQNPFDCTCKLRWLADLLQRRQLQQSSGTYYMSEHSTNSDVRKSRHSSTNTLQQGGLNVDRNAPLDGDMLKPFCHEPNRLKGRLIESLTKNDFYCDVPKLQGLAVDLSELTGVEGYKVKKSNQSIEERETVNQMEVKLKCNIKGSPEMSLSWYKRILYESNVNIPGSEYQMEKLLPLQNTKLISPGEMELRLTQPLLGRSGGTIESTVTEELVCLASDTSGNTSAEIRITWPSNKHDRKEKGNTINNHNKQYPVAKVADTGYWDRNNDKPRHSPAIHVEDNWYLLDTNGIEGFWFKERFSVVEMIGAVVGTFTVTLALFVLICCLLRVHRHHRDFIRSKILLQQTTSYHHRSTPLTKPSVPPPIFSSDGYPSSSVMLSGETRNFPSKSSLYPNVSANYSLENGTVTSNLTSSGKYPPFGTYALTNITEPNCSTIYSEGPTYDLPQLPPIQSPPSAPLPPIPVMQKINPLGKFIPSSPSCPPSSVTCGVASCSVIHPITVSNAMNGPRIATLTRLDGSGQLCQMNLMGSASQHNLAVSPNPLFGYINQQPIFKTQLQEAN